jgi:hypothetical protein
MVLTQILRHRNANTMKEDFAKTSKIVNLLMENKN